MLPEAHVGKILTENRQTISLAESCTGGQICDRLTNIPGSSQYLKGGIIAYANDIKARIMKVEPKLIKQHGAVSRPVAEIMAKQVRKIFKSDYGVSITGIAGPSGGTLEKPVGLVYIAVAHRTKVICQEYRFSGARQDIKNQSADTALKLLLKII